MTESQLTRLTESEGAPVLDRVVREGFPEEVILGRGLKEVTGQARRLSEQRVFQVEGTASTKTLYLMPAMCQACAESTSLW